MKRQSDSSVLTRIESSLDRIAGKVEDRGLEAAADKLDRAADLVQEVKHSLERLRGV